MSIFDSSSFMPHGHCYLWSPEILWMHVASDFIIFASYFSIPVAIAFYMKKTKVKNQLFSAVSFLFILFILLCGLTHLMAIWTTWNPNYAIEGVLKTATAVVSLITAVALWPLIPVALRIPSPENLKQANLKLSELNNNLEKNVVSRTQELTNTNADLEKFNKLVIGRELKMIDLKKEVNQLCQQLGMKNKYSLEFESDE